MAIVINDCVAMNITPYSAYIRAFYHAPSPAVSVYVGFIINGTKYYLSNAHYGQFTTTPDTPMVMGGYFGTMRYGLNQGTSYSFPTFALWYVGTEENWYDGPSVEFTTVPVIDQPGVLDGLNLVSALQVIEGVTNSCLGRCYVDAEGKLSYESRLHRVAT